MSYINRIPHVKFVGKSTHQVKSHRFSPAAGACGHSLLLLPDHCALVLFRQQEVFVRHALPKTTQREKAQQDQYMIGLTLGIQSTAVAGKSPVDASAAREGASHFFFFLSTSVFSSAFVVPVGQSQELESNPSRSLILVMILYWRSQSVMFLKSARSSPPSLPNLAVPLFPPLPQVQPPNPQLLLLPPLLRPPPNLCVQCLPNPVWLHLPHPESRSQWRLHPWWGGLSRLPKWSSAPLLQHLQLLLDLPLDLLLHLLLDLPALTPVSLGSFLSPQPWPLPQFSQKYVIACIPRPRCARHSAHHRAKH
jgi:hypothetical protein